MDNQQFLDQEAAEEAPSRPLRTAGFTLLGLALLLAAAALFLRKK